MAPPNIERLIEIYWFADSASLSLLLLAVLPLRIFMTTACVISFSITHRSLPPHYLLSFTLVILHYYYFFCWTYTLRHFPNWFLFKISICCHSYFRSLVCITPTIFLTSDFFTISDIIIIILSFISHLYLFTLLSFFVGQRRTGRWRYRIKA